MRRSGSPVTPVARPVKTAKQVRQEWMIAAGVCAVLFAPFAAWFAEVVASA